VLKKKIFYLLPHDVRRALFSVLRSAEFGQMQKERTIDTKEGFSYKHFDQHQCIFVHIPKTAGVSISRTVFGNLGGRHRPIKKYQLIFSKKEFDRYFKFTFVRNPWDRVFSAYNFLKKGGMNEENRRWAASNLAPYKDFEDFIKRGLNKSNVKQHMHFSPQYGFLCVRYSQGISVDFLGFFENIQDDFEYILNKLSLNPNLPLRHDNKTASSDKLNFRDFYTNEMRDTVAEVYERDIELLGYNFDNSSLESQLINRSA